jgi:alkylhydroperoxidase/carboxymuconolactone decarboxylase family protein YurZ
MKNVHTDDAERNFTMENISIDQLLAKMSEEFGGEPEIMKLLSGLKPEGVFEHAKNKSFAMGSNSIPPKFQLLMAIAVSAAMGSEGCTLTYAKVASNKGLTNEEIMDSIMLARFISATAVVNTAGETMKMLLGKTGSK